MTVLGGGTPSFSSSEVLVSLCALDGAEVTLRIKDGPACASVLLVVSDGPVIHVSIGLSINNTYISTLVKQPIIKVRTE